MQLVKRSAIFLIVVFLVAFLLLNGDLFGGVYTDIEGWVRGVFDSTLSEKVERLEAENQRLRFEIQRMEKDTQRDVSSNFLAADVFSTHPFNYKNTLVVDVGSLDGVEEGDPVFVEEGIALGVVTEVHKTQSEVRTIFDAGWKSSVGIGDTGIQAVLKGGDSPSLDLIAQEAGVEAGDYVYNLDSRLPMKVLFGSVVDVESEQGEVWQKAGLEVVYNPGRLEQVLIHRKFP